MPKRPNSDESRTYQIGTVSSLTGVDAHTIRAWERRYGAIKPSRSATGRRQYDDDTVERLQLLKGLVDCSEPIGSIAHLSDEELRLRLAKLAEHEGLAGAHTGAEPIPDHKPRLALLAPALAVQVGANAVALSDFELAVTSEDSESLLTSLRRTPCDVIVFELDRLGDRAPAIAQDCAALPGAPQVVVLYRFAPRVQLARIARAGATAVRMPIRLESLRRVILDQMMIRRARGRRPIAQAPSKAKRVEEADAGSDPIAFPRRFDDQQLSRLFELSSAIDCECPNHLSSLVAGLVAFEKYSRECESRDEADAEQHRRLAEGTAQARAGMEDLLADLCENEGIVV